MDNPLSEIMEEIKTQKAIAEMDPRRDANNKEITLTNVIRHREGNSKQAKEKLRELYSEYRRAIMNNSIFILVIGSSADKFGDKSSELFGTFSYDAEALYSGIVDKVPAKLYLDKTTDRLLFEHLMARFEDRAYEMGVASYEGILFKKEYQNKLKDKQDVVNLLKDVFHKTIGSEVVGLDVIEKTSIEAVNRGFEGKVVPILLHTTDLSFAQKLAKDLYRLSPHVILVKSGSFKKGENLTTDISVDKITNKSIEKVMATIKDRVM